MSLDYIIITHGFGLVMAFYVILTHKMAFLGRRSLNDITNGEAFRDIQNVSDGLGNNNPS